MSTQVRLKKGKSSLLALRSPWIFSGALEKLPPNLEQGQWVDVLDEYGRIVATGHFHPSSIAVRVLQFHEMDDLKGFYQEKLRQAYYLRQRLGCIPNQSTSAYRLVHGEGDGLSGLIIDVYSQVAIIQCHTLGMWRDIPHILEGLLGLPGTPVISVYTKSASILPHADVQDGFLFGPKVDALEVIESGIKYKVDFIQGQKTGLFIDQRINRALLSNYCRNKKVLNTFCYTGGFSLAALQGGADEVVSVDQSSWAIDHAIKNVEANFGTSCGHTAVISKVVPYLQNLTSKFDIIIVDPPAYAKNLDHRHGAIKAYSRLNFEAIKQLNPGGLLFTFSCSQVVGRELFEGAVLSAAMEAKRDARILHYLEQSPDHPVNIFHREGLYLKGLVLEFD